LADVQNQESLSIEMPTLSDVFGTKAVSSGLVSPADVQSRKGKATAASTLAGNSHNSQNTTLHSEHEEPELFGGII